jgi:hypothetical protein
MADAAIAKARNASVAVLVPQDSRASIMPMMPMAAAESRATATSSVSVALPLRITAP